MNANVTEMRDVSNTELRTVEGGWGTVVARLTMFIMGSKYGNEPSFQEKAVASLSPSEKP